MEFYRLQRENCLFDQLNFCHGRLMSLLGKRGGSVVERRTPEREVGCSKPTSTVECP